MMEDNYENLEQNDNDAQGYNEPDEYSTEGKKKNSSLKVILGLLILALLGSWGYFLMSNKQNTQEKEKLTATIETGNTEKEDLQNELNDASRRLDELRSSNLIADSVIQSKDRDIKNLKDRISGILRDKNATAKQLAEARQLIAQLNGNIESYSAQIDQLKEENSQLLAQNEQVTAERDQARQNFDSATNIISEKQGIIDVGSTLHASNFRVAAVKEKRSGKEKSTVKARKVDKLKVAFSLDENRITESGPKELYISIVDPAGKPVVTDNTESGRFVTRDGVNRYFTKKMNVDYTQGNKKDVDFDWEQDKFQGGSYLVEVYNNGFKIGEGTIALKK